MEGAQARCRGWGGPPGLDTGEVRFTSWQCGELAHAHRPAQGPHEREEAREPAGWGPECPSVPSRRLPTLPLTSKSGGEASPQPSSGSQAS